jgi:hypothetical protein
MEIGTSTNILQIERKLLAAFERHGADGRAMTVESLAATAGIAGRAKELALALAHLVERGLIRRAGEDPIPGSAIAFRLVTRTSRERIAEADDQAAPRISPSSAAEPITSREAAKSSPKRRASVPAQ